MAAMRCCHCAAMEMDCPGIVHEGWPYALCSEHHGYFMKRAKESPPPRVVTFPRTAEEEYVDRCIQSALDGAAFSPLADIAK